MAWFRLDDQVTFHEKVLAAGNEAFGAWVRMGTWSAARALNGKVTASAARAIAGTKKVVDRLVEVGLLDIDGADYQVHDYLHWNPSADQVEKKRLERQAAGRRGGQKSAETRRTKAEANAQATGEAIASATAQANANQTASKPEPKPVANSNPVPVPVPVPSASGEADSQNSLTRTRPHAMDEYKVQQRWAEAWEMANLPGHPLLISVIAEWRRTPDHQRPTPESACKSYKERVDQMRADKLRPHVGAEHMLRCWGDIVDDCRGEVKPRAGAGAKRNFREASPHATETRDETDLL